MPTGLLIAIALSSGPLLAQESVYRFPSSDEHYTYFYPTAYYDHSGVDWACGDFQYSGHEGSDYGVGGFDGMDAGRDLVAAWQGTVYATNDGEYDRCTSGDCSGGGGYGNYVMIEHPNGQITVYGHMRQWTVAVAVGDSVDCGTPLGQVGSSGYSTGPHVHFEVRESSGSRSDPFDGDCSYPPSYWVSQGDYSGKPSLRCYETGPCEPAGQLSCGDTLTTSNDAAGSTDLHFEYGCSDFAYTGPELAWSFSTDRDEPVSISMTGLAADLDLYVLDSTACDGSGCVSASTNSDSSDEEISFDALAGVSYTVLADGWEDAVSSFSLAVSCEGSPVPNDTADDSGADSGGPPDSGASDSQPPTDSQDPASSSPGTRHNLEDQLGCGCAQSHWRGTWLWLLACLPALTRRRHREPNQRSIEPR